MLQAAVSDGVSSIRGQWQDKDSVGLSRLVALFAACMAVGVLAGASPAYGLLAVLGLAFAAVVIASPMLGLILFTVLSFLEVLQSGGAASSLMKVAGLLLFGSWLARTATTRTLRDSRSLLRCTPTVVWSAVALVAWSTISLAWAGDSSSAISDTYRYVLNMLLVPIVFGTVRTRNHVIWLASAFVFGAVISSLYGFAVPTASTGLQAGQLTGAIGDANEEAAVLVGAIAFAFGLVGVLRTAPLARLLAALGILIALAGAVNTLSRSGLIALAAMMIAGVIAGGRWRRWAALLLILNVVVGIGYYFTITSSSTRARVTSSDTSGRSTIWTVGWRMFKDHPVIGVGSGNFQSASIHYLQAPGALTRTDLIVDTPKVAHNVYLELLADLGIPGLVAFLVLVVGSLAAAWRAAQIFLRSGDPDLELMSRCVVLAIVGFMTSNFFLSGEYSKQLWLVLALGPTLLGMALKREAQVTAVSEPVVSFDDDAAFAGRAQESA